MKTHTKDLTEFSFEIAGKQASISMSSVWVGVYRRQPGFAALAGGLCSVRVTVIAAPPVTSEDREKEICDNLRLTICLRDHVSPV